MYRRSQRWMLIINNRFLSVYDYNFLLFYEKIFSVKQKLEDYLLWSNLSCWVLSFLLLGHSTNGIACLICNLLDNFSWSVFSFSFSVTFCFFGEIRNLTTFTRLMDYNNGFSLSSFFLSLISFLWIGAQFPQEKFLSYGRILTLHYYFLLMCILLSLLSFGFLQR